MRNANQMNKGIAGRHLGIVGCSVERIADDVSASGGQATLRASTRQRPHMMTALHQTRNQALPHVSRAAGDKYLFCFWEIRSLGIHAHQQLRCSSAIGFLKWSRKLWLRFGLELKPAKAFCSLAAVGCVPVAP